MSTYKTGNPLGSAAVKDLFDNAENLDFALNSLTALIWTDRLGKTRLSFFGMESAFVTQLTSQENRFDTFIASSGYDVIGDYTSGPLKIEEYNQLIRYNNELYKLTAATDIPFTTAGNTDETWTGTDAAHFVSVGDAALRQNLGSDEAGLGVNLVYGALKQVSITNFLSLADLIRFDNGELVNVDNAIAVAKAAGHEHIYFPNGHFELSSTTTLGNIMLIGSNKSQFGDIKLETSDGSSGKLSLETDGSVLHITGDAAANGITLSNSGSGFTSSLIGIVGFSIYYPGQDWKNWTLGTTADIDGDFYYLPTEYPPTFVADVSMRVCFDKLFFINAYHWIDIKNAQLVTFGKIAGSLLNRGYTVTRMAAGGVTESFISYPFWTWACNFAGISQRVNHYCDAEGKSIQVGLDDGVTRTVEQMRIIHAVSLAQLTGLSAVVKAYPLLMPKLITLCAVSQLATMITRHTIRLARPGSHLTIATTTLLSSEKTATFTGLNPIRRHRLICRDFRWCVLMVVACDALLIWKPG